MHGDVFGQASSLPAARDLNHRDNFAAEVGVNSKRMIGRLFQSHLIRLIWIFSPIV